MPFRIFHCDPNSLTLDNQIIYRPDYVSVMQWLEFWEKPEDTSEDDLKASYDEGYNNGYNNGKEDEDAVEKSEERGYEKAIKDIRDDLKNAVDWFSENLFNSSLNEKEAVELIDLLNDRIDSIVY